jgi:hypothetical protein
MKRIEDKKHPTSGRRQIVLEHEWREDFVGEALSLEVDDDGKLHSVEFYSADHGVVTWHAGKGLGSARRWETEDEAGSASGVAGKHYAAAFLDGATTDMHALAIVGEVLKHLESTALGSAVREALARPHLEHKLDEAWVPATEAEETPAPEPSAKRGVARTLKRAVLDLMRPYAAWSDGKKEDE